MRRVEQMGATVVKHGSPAGGRRRNTQAEKAHGGFSENGSGHADGGLHDYGLNNVRENVAGDDAKIAGSEGAGGFDVFLFAGGQHLGTDQAGVSDPTAERQCEHKIEDAGAAEGDEGDSEKNAGEREKSVHYDDVDETVETAAVVSG